MGITFNYGDETKFEIAGLRLRKYPSNGATALVAIINVRENGEIVEQEQLPISVNLDHTINGFASRELPPDEFYVKSYSEGEKPYEALLAAGIIEPTGKMAQTGYVTLPACRLTLKGRAMLEGSPANKN